MEEFTLAFHSIFPKLFNITLKNGVINGYLEEMKNIIVCIFKCQQVNREMPTNKLQFKL